MSAALAPITIEVIVKAPVETAWKALTEPEHMVQWNFAIPEWHCPAASNDLRVGGKMTARMEARDGSMGFDFGGTYTEVTLHRSMAYVLDDGRKVFVTLTPQGSATKVTQTFDPESQNTPERQRGGWQSILDNYKKHAETIR